MRIKEQQRRVNRYIKNLNKNVADLGWHFKQVGRKIYNIPDGVTADPIRPYYYFQKKHSEKINDDAILVCVKAIYHPLDDCKVVNWGWGKHEDTYGKYELTPDVISLNEKHAILYVKRPENYNLYAATLQISFGMPDYELQYDPVAECFKNIWDDHKIVCNLKKLEWGRSYTFTEKKCYSDEGNWDGNVYKDMVVNIQMWHNDGTTYDLEVWVSSLGQLGRTIVYQKDDPRDYDQFPLIVNNLIIEHNNQNRKDD